jgi:signal-transduction protein with cAMP-binding, CBS, and nucleotidyltransferase domain
MWCWNPECDAKVCASCENLERSFTALLCTIQPTAELVANLPQLCRELWKERIKRLAGERKVLVQKLNAQGTLNSKAVTARVEDKISAEDFAVLKNNVKNTSAGYTEQIKLIDSETSTLESMMVEASGAMVNLAMHWDRVGITQKQELQRALFPEGLLVSREKGYFEPGNTSLIEDYKLFFNSLEGSPTFCASMHINGRGDRI